MVSDLFLNAEEQANLGAGTRDERRKEFMLQMLASLEISNPTSIRNLLFRSYATFQIVLHDPDLLSRIQNECGGLDPLLEWIGNRSLVLIGEASHDTHDFYRERALITRRLIEEKGFKAVAIEGDWPDAYRVHKFVRGTGPDSNAYEALSEFTRFPAWMWRNTDVLAFIDWLREFNTRIPQREDRVGFYGQAMAGFPLAESPVE